MSSCPNCPTNEETGVAQVNGDVSKTHVGIETANPNGKVATQANGHGQSNGQQVRNVPEAHASQPMRYSDFLSNVSNFKIIESTLRGE